MARLRDIVVDCAHPASLARFWAAALDGYRVAAYDDEELRRLRAIGIDDPEDDPSVLVEPVDGTGPRLFCTLVPEARAGKNRLHLDLMCSDHATEVDRLLRLGARVHSEHAHWTTLTDPEGNEFCLLR